MLGEVYDTVQQSIERHLQGKAAPEASRDKR